MLTTHTRERIWKRLNGVVTNKDVGEFIKAAQHFTSGKHYVRIRELDRVYWTEDSVGDCLICVIINGVVVTAMLSFTSQRWDDGDYWRLT